MIIGIRVKNWEMEIRVYYQGLELDKGLEFGILICDCGWGIQAEIGIWHSKLETGILLRSIEIWKQIENHT